MIINEMSHKEYIYDFTIIGDKLIIFRFYIFNLLTLEFVKKVKTGNGKLFAMCGKKIVHIYL